jgi:hypothetical protein
VGELPRSLDYEFPPFALDPLFCSGSLIPVPILQLGALISLEVPPAAGT